MKAVEFAYWLQGLFELANPKTLDEKQTDLIKRHLAMVFKHEIDPSYPNQEELNQLHVVDADPSIPQHLVGGGLTTIRC